MGTSWSVNLVAAHGQRPSQPAHDLHALHARVEAVLAQVDAQMSTWRDDSDVSRFNRAAPGWVALPQELMEVLRCALDIARASDGAFDPTVGPLVDAWGFGPRVAADAAPSPDALDALRARVGFEVLALRDDDGAAWQPGELALDLSAIAKGYAVDLVAARLRSLGVDSALVEVGGELLGYGRKPDGTRWRVLVETDPERDDAAPVVLSLDGTAVATSGDRWHRREHDGREIAHTLDPRNGRPLERAPLAVTVIAQSVMHADAWATALSVLGAQAGLALAEARGIAARFVVRGDGAVEVHASAAFARHVAA